MCNQMKIEESGMITLKRMAKKNEEMNGKKLLLTKVIVSLISSMLCIS